MKKKIITVFLFTALVITACGLQKQENAETTPSPAAEPTQTAAAIPTPLSKTAKKTTKEAFGPLLNEDWWVELQNECFSKEYDSVRHDDISEWKDKKGNYTYPKDYEIDTMVGSEKPSALASQQMPQELLDEISTEDLYRLIIKAPTDYYGWYAPWYDTYLSILVRFYTHYNFIEELMEREDAPEVVHRYYTKYSEKEVEKYSLRSRSQVNYKKRGRFQLTEGLEWFFLYREGKEVPDYQVLGHDLVKAWYWDGTEWQMYDEIPEDD